MSAGFDPAPGHRWSFPGSYIGRQIAYFRVRFADTKNDGTIDYNNYSTYLRIIQTQAELILAGVPRVAENWGTFIVGLAYDTANNAGDGMGKTITQLLQTFDNDAQLTRVWMVKDLWMEESDYLDYIDANWDTTKTPNVYGHGSPEQDEFNIQWAGY
jgi:hypothetical protein